MGKKTAASREGLLKLGVFKLLRYDGRGQVEEGKAVKTEERDRIMGLREVCEQAGGKNGRFISLRHEMGGHGGTRGNLCSVSLLYAFLFSEAKKQRRLPASV